MANVPHVTVGVNAVSRELESRMDTARPRTGHASLPEGPLSGAPRLLFVCVADMDPPALVAHLPLLVASYNATCVPAWEVQGAAADETGTPSVSWAPRPQDLPTSGHLPLVLVTLPSGAELMLSTALRVRRLSALLVKATLPEHLLARLVKSLENTAIPLHDGFRAPWMERVSLAPPRIKHLSTSAPVNTTQAKVEKREQRQARKRAARTIRAADCTSVPGPLRNGTRPAR